MGVRIIPYDPIMILKRSVSPSVISQIEWVWDGVVNAKVARYGPMSMGEPLAGLLGFLR